MAPSTLSLDTAVENMYCGTILHILENSTEYSQQERSRAVNAFVDEAPGRVYSYIVTYCNGDQLNKVLSRSLVEGWWQSVGCVLEKGTNDKQLRQNALKEACKRADGSNIEKCILPHCCEDELDLVLPQLVERGLWSSVGKVLERGGNDGQRKQAINQAIERASDNDVDHHILPHCKDNETDDALTHLVTRGLWSCVGKLLDRGVSDSQRRLAVEEASKRADGKDFRQHIQRHCEGHSDVALNHLVIRGLWRSVDSVLSKGVSDEQWTFAVEEASKTADDEEFEKHILPHCSADLIDRVLKHLVRRGLWQSVGKVLKRDEPDHFFAIEESSKRADDTTFRDHIMPRCSEDQLHAVLTHLLTRRLWSSLKRILETEVWKGQCRLAVEVCKCIPNDVDFERNILPHCDSLQVDAALPHLALRGLWVSVRRVLQKGQGSVANRLFAIENAVERAGDEGVVVDTLLEVCNDEEKASVVLPGLVKTKKWELVQTVFCDCVLNAVNKWSAALTKKHTVAKDDNFWLIFHYCHIRTSHQTLAAALAQNMNAIAGSFWPIVGLNYMQDYKVLLQCVLFILCCVISRGLTKQLHMINTNIVSDIYKVMFTDTLFKTAELSEVVDVYVSNGGNLLLDIVNRPHPLLPGALSVILRLLLHHQRWDVLGNICLSTAWEHVRRELFQAAVEQRQWKTAMKWTDHTLYDNQRWWALEEAYKEQQWEVMLLLADHGLTEIELMRVRYRIAKHADWQVVLQMLERGVDVTEVREIVEMATKSRKGKRDRAKHDALIQRWKQLLKEEKELTNFLYGKTGTEKASLEDTVSRKTAKKRAVEAAKSQKWSLVFFYFSRHFGERYLQGALRIAIKSGAWHVVIQLVRLGMNEVRQCSLFLEMVDQQQWGVCRALLDKGLNVQICLEVLPQLMKMNQWMLVARVMEFSVDDAVRQQVLQRAMERREGSVVWRCISTMQHYRLSVEEREELFQQAFSHGVLQALLPLIEEKDSTGIQHRDKALLAATEHHHWDVVDHCQLHHADIDMKDTQGETSLNRAARKKEWRAVEELVARGADPNILDTEGCSVLYRAMIHQQWSTVKLLIEYFADIHMTSKEDESLYEELKSFSNPHAAAHGDIVPLKALIGIRQCDIINHTLLWCSGQSKARLNYSGETVLHAMAFGEKPELLYYQVVRGVDPLQVTTGDGFGYWQGTALFRGQSVLAYAVQNQRPQKMVAECIRLGFSTHQPQITKQNLGRTFEFSTSDQSNFVHNIKGHLDALANACKRSIVSSVESPLLLTILKGDLVLTHMLFEAGSSSNAELYYVYGGVQAVTDPFTQEHKDVVRFVGARSDIAKGLITSFEMVLPYLKEMATTPRSLVSSCRLVISHCLNVRGRRHRDVQQLNQYLHTVDDEMKSYLMFSDLTDPDYSYAKTPRSLASSCRLAIFARLFFCSRGRRAGEGKNSVPCSLDDIIQNYLKKSKAMKDRK